jgi:hypothetical protein
LKKLLPLFIVFILGSGFVSAQEINVGAGISIGGPIPTEPIDSTSGNALIGTIAGISFSFPLSERFSFIPMLQYSFRGLDYGQIYTRDTMITIDINGSGGQVPSYYTAYIEGKMRLHYIEIPLLLGYRFWKIQMLLGPYASILLAGYDTGNVKVVIGSGGVFDDHYEEFDNYPALRKAELGIMLGTNAPIYKNLGIEIKVTRSFCTLYNLDKLPNSGEQIVPMYNTYVQMGLIYRLKGD